MIIRNNFFHLLPVELFLKICVHHSDLKTQDILTRVNTFFLKLLQSDEAWHIRYLLYGFLNSYSRPAIARQLWHFERRNDLLWKVTGPLVPLGQFGPILWLDPFLVVIRPSMITILNLSDLTIQSYTPTLPLVSACTDQDNKQYALGGRSLLLVGSCPDKIYPRALSLGQKDTASAVCFLKPTWLAWACEKAITILDLEQEDVVLYHFQLVERVKSMHFCGDLLECLVGQKSLFAATYRYSVQIQHDDHTQEVTHYCVGTSICSGHLKAECIGKRLLFIRPNSIDIEPLPNQQNTPSCVFRKYESSMIIRGFQTLKTQHCFVLLNNGLFEYLDPSGKLVAASTFLQKNFNVDFAYKNVFVVGTTIFGVATVFSNPVEQPSRITISLPCRFMWNAETGNSYIRYFKTRIPV